MKHRTTVQGSVKVSGTADVDDLTIKGDSVADKLADLERRIAQLEAGAAR